mmetsp:Transcript_92654/g.257705  ORF Transcript_92654/g.257705 Transcript_92654/m.257705 type:complete len:122 (-) Transcript_92654:115-480(-)
MKSFGGILLLLSIALVFCLQTVATFGFTSPRISSNSLSSTTSTSTSTTSLRFGPFSAPKDDGTPGDYVCKDCGYVFTKGPKAWAALPDDYSCPPCGAPKRRFKKVPKGSESGKVEVKKSWF